MPDQTVIALSIVTIAALALLWRVYRKLKRSSCCGSCGCNLMSDKAKKKMLQQRSKGNSA